MAQAESALETAQGFTPPTVTQFSVFMPNRVGKLHDVVEAFETTRGVQVCALSVHEAADHAVVRVITNNSGIARRILREHDLAFCEKDVLVVELTSGHTLGSLCLALLAAELNIQFAYALMLRPNGTPTIALAVDDYTMAGQILRRKEYRLFGEADILDVH